MNIPGCRHPLPLLASAVRHRSKTSSDGSVLAVEAAAVKSRVPAVSYEPWCVLRTVVQQLGLELLGKPDCTTCDSHLGFERLMKGFAGVMQQRRVLRDAAVCDRLDCTDGGHVCHHAAHRATPKHSRLKDR